MSFRRLILVSGVALSMGAVVLLPTPAVAATPCVDQGFVDDVNGDGRSDQVGSDPGASVAGAPEAGRLWVRYGAPGGSTQRSYVQGAATIGGAAEARDRFGAAIAVGLVDGDLCADVVVSAPGENLGAAVNAGSVSVVFGAPDGLGTGRATRTLTGATGGGSLQDGETFGAVVALGDRFDPETQNARLTIGAPGRTVGGAAAAGGITVVEFGPTGTPAQVRAISQSSAGVPGVSEPGDRFGAAVTLGRQMYGRPCSTADCADPVIGVPGEDDDAGAVVLMHDPIDTGAGKPLEAQVLSQATAGMGGASEAGDRFGASVSAGYEGFTGTPYVAVGIPGEDVGGARDAGAVQTLRFSEKIFNRQLSRATSGINGAPRAGDRFGAAVHVDHGYITGFVMILAVGVPGHDAGQARDAGAVQVMRLQETPGTTDVVLTQASAGVPGAVEAGDRFGAVLSGTSGTLDVGVPDDHGYPRGITMHVSWARIFGVGTEAGTWWSPSAGSRFGAALP